MNKRSTLALKKAKLRELQSDVADLEEEIKLAELEEAKESLKTPTAELAIKLHDRLCRLSHIDQCSFHYELASGVVNYRDATKAREILELVDFETAMKIVDIL